MNTEQRYKIIILQGKLYAKIEIRKVLVNVGEMILDRIEPLYHLQQIQEALRKLVDLGFVTNDEHIILVAKVLNSFVNFPNTEDQMGERAREHRRLFTGSIGIKKN